MSNLAPNRTDKYLPYAFVKQGVDKLNCVLCSQKVIIMNIAKMRAFIEIRKVLLLQSDFKEQMKEIRQRSCVHDAQLNQIYEAIEIYVMEKLLKENRKSGKELNIINLILKY